ncbi:MAG: class I SAM-dependent methyltransferase [Methyloversatilis sp.]|uniref:class I SAM-dependent methyltransferase n=1 Tax=Methyloversatilis sp. TaxID=2569862 RepID=UPI0027370909|nr:class I SAM-dependent methyltransferase [Methyloversatilis sp.]MDP3871893.1 class I SAM-dependent methyltransferase [Methyloversatilis sp.]
MNDGTKKHWEDVYASKAPDSVSWFQPHAQHSLDLIARAGIGLDAAIIDVGGGASTLVDDLLARGHTDLSVLDLSATSLHAAQARLGDAAAKVKWIEADITTVELPPRRFDLWHDRAVFHFLTDSAQRDAYVATVLRAVKPGGHVIVAAFAEDGPERCSGLPVMRYGANALHAQFGARFELLEHSREVHHTPTGVVQQFVYCFCRRSAS